MRLQILAVGQRPPAWVSEGYASYAKRFNAPYSLSLQEIQAQKRLSDIAKVKRDEGDKVLAAIGRQARLIALDENGVHLSSKALAIKLSDWQVDGRPCVFAIGGADGHDQRVLERAEFCWSLSKLTFPHAMVRVLIAEQLFRAVSMNNGHPYHRE